MDYAKLAPDHGWRMTDAWLSMGDSELTRAERFAALTPYRVTPQMMEQANPDAVQR